MQLPLEELVDPLDEPEITPELEPLLLELVELELVLEPPQPEVPLDEVPLDVPLLDAPLLPDELLPPPLTCENSQLYIGKGALVEKSR